MLAQKILGSLGVVAATAAVAGMGTFGSFTASTSVSTAVQSGTVSVNLAVPGGAKTIPLSTDGFMPGDTLSRAVNLANDGNTALSSVSVIGASSASNALVTDQANGLQLTLRSCSRAWTETDTAGGVPTYTCGGTQSTLYAGTAVTTQTLPNPASLTPGGTDRLVFTLALPTTAGNDKQGLAAPITIAFVGVQRDGSPR